MSHLEKYIESVFFSSPEDNVSRASYPKTKRVAKFRLGGPAPSPARPARTKKPQPHRER